MLLRSRIPELMDDPRLDRELHVEALRGLEVLNKVSGSAQILWTELNKISANKQNQPLTVLDVATGSGDILIELAKLSKRFCRQIEYTGADISPTAIAHAEEKAKKVNAPV